MGSMEIVSVFEADRAYYRNLVPQDIMSDLAADGRFMLGAVKDGSPIGCLCFSVEMEPFKYQIMAKIDWMYVIERERTNETVMDELLSRLKELCRNAQIEWIACETSLMPIYDVLVAYLEHKGFHFYLKDNMTYQISVGDGLCTSMFEQEQEPYPVIYLEDMTDRDFRTGLRRVLMQSQDEKLAVLNSLDRNAYDNKCSCIAMKDGEIKGAILIATLPSGTVQVKLLYAVGGNQIAWYYSLIVGAMRRLVECKPMYETITVCCNRKQAAELIAKMYPDAKSGIVRGGICHVK